MFEIIYEKIYIHSCIDIIEPTACGKTTGSYGIKLLSKRRHGMEVCKTGYPD